MKTLMSVRGTRLGRAFSLVELLVVISIIALLMSILLPSLKRAREQGRRVVCGSHLRGLANAWEIYAITFQALPPLARAGIDINYKRNRCTEQMQRVETGGFGPDSFPAFLNPLPHPECASSFHPEWLTIFFRNQIFQVALPEGSDGEFGRWRNFGLLWVAGVLDDPRVFFCPSQRDPDLAWDTPYNPWPPSIETCRRPDNHHIANHTESSFERRAGMTGVPWDRVGLRTVIAGDIMWPDVVRTTHREGISAAYRDGHAVFIRDPRFADWWSDDDSWTDGDSRVKFLQMSHWLDLQGSR